MNQVISNQTGFRGDLPLIYVVDDEPMLLELASVILEPLGFAVATFRDAETALQQFAKSVPHPILLVTDFAMHHMTGLELIAACRGLVPTQKILLVSGTVDERVFQHAQHKPDRFLPKPYQAHQLAHVVQTLLGSDAVAP